ncbi:bifunctional aminoglycoside phosphotransferase/ATP-binding protein [Ramlibacter aquaticus]|uniref:bifunctional aminoglycoside phosphotransferase/ATP-binding protein n=1 Tax=Ramlibacter aquaticus TaxID=2780094 RepID=UPI002AB0C2FF|nr:AAA family ATPase [Ramlibacter aquaticus]
MHGDLHLANLVEMPDGSVAAFDGIEFDPALRWIDVADDIAFPVMDLEAQGRRDLAFRLLNGWLDWSGDHGALAVLRFALASRALVRAQVGLLQGQSARARRYVQAALRWMAEPAPRLAITHGLPGAGKSFAAQHWLEREGAIRLRSDVERKRLFGLRQDQDSRSAGLDIYGPEAGARTYAQLMGLARAALAAGWPVVLDAAFLRRAEREAAAALARSLGLPFAILHCEASATVLRERLRTRQGDPSEADEAVLERLQAAHEPLDADEAAHVIRLPD